MRYLKLFDNKYNDYHIFNGELVPSSLYFHGNLNLNNNKDIRKLPDNFTIYGYLDLDNTLIDKLPDNLYVIKELYLNNTLVRKLPDNLHVNRLLSINGSPLVQRYSEKDIRKKCHIGGKIYPENLNGSEEKYQRWLLEQDAKKYNI